MAVRPFAAVAAVGILTLGLATAPPSVAVPRTEVRAVQLVAVTTSPVSVPRPATASQTADDTAAPPDFLAFAASILEYLNSLGVGAGPGLAAIGLSGVVVAFAATAYAWNGFADTVNPGLRFLHIPQVPKFPVCFAGQSCASSSASAQARIKTANRVATTTRPTGGTRRSTAATGRTTLSPTAAKVSGATKSTPSATAGKGTSKRARSATAH
ncbi:hypothetical protein [Mycolicibacterium sp. P1-5]|uniref:hypothetical protein n=1 Tax=Mycolicibacterium sp. P1-5 TaxID=2024617 RepID=UPI0011EC8B46|nr:hypothetical protein [Mycolicibacterium sp. P1-5]